MFDVGLNLVTVIDNFISDEDCNQLTQWTLANYMSPYFQPACGRISTRHTKVGVPFPNKAYSVQEKIISTLNLHEALLAPFCDGMYSGLARNKDEVFYEMHRDPVYVDGTYTLHCNIVTTNSADGDVYIEENGVIAMKKGRLVAYPVSELNHEVKPSVADGIRNLWVFGFCVTKQ